MIANTYPIPSEQLRNLPQHLPQLFDPSYSVKVVEVAKKYDDGNTINAIPEYTAPGGPNHYICTDVSKSWTQGFFPGLIWLLAERQNLLASSVHPSYSKEELLERASRWQDSFRHLARPGLDHDQGFRFQLSFGKDHGLTGSKDARAVLVEAAESMMDRYDEKLGMFRSWDFLPPRFGKDADPTDHFLVIMDSMMNLDMMYEATILTGDNRFAGAATIHAKRCSKSHIREDGTTYHVVDFDPVSGKVEDSFSAQGWADETCWARGQAWGIYGFAQCALRTGDVDFVIQSRILADVFLSRLQTTGVPKWDFDAPEPAPYDASAATVAACGLRMLSELLNEKDPLAAGYYLGRGIKLVIDTLDECASPPATLQDAMDEGGGGKKVDWGQGGWETILMHSTIAGNEMANRRLMDHGLIYADYYLLEFGNELLKMSLASMSPISTRAEVSPKKVI